MKQQRMVAPTRGDDNGAPKPLFIPVNTSRLVSVGSDRTAHLYPEWMDADKYRGLLAAYSSSTCRVYERYWERFMVWLRDGAPSDALLAEYLQRRFDEVDPRTGKPISPATIDMIVLQPMPR